MTRVAVAPHKYAKGFQPGQEQVREPYRVMDLREALCRTYPGDAHLVTYLVEGAVRQPRINKPGLELYGKRVWVEAFFCDVDNEDHALWTDESFAAAREQDRSLPSLATAGVYYTRRGRRIVQPLAAPVAVPEVEAYLRRWLGELEADGLAVDWACRDWTRHFRLPNVPREPGGRSRCIDLERMRPIALAPLPPEELAPPAKPRAAVARKPAGARVGAYAGDLPDMWQPAARLIAAAVRKVSSEWHTLFLALAGSLLTRGVPPDIVPAFCGRVSVLTGADSRTTDRIASARSTVERWVAGLNATGMTALRAHWPDVAGAVEASVPGSAGPPPSVELPGLEETTRRLEQAIREAPDGLTILQAGCGIGKTRAAERIAAERASTPYASADALGKRAPVHSKTSLSVDKHALASQVVRHLDVLQTSSGWHFGPLARKHADGSPVCRYHAVALPLVAGGQSVQWELCEGRGISPCEHHQECPARLGYEGADNPRVHVGPHALLPRLDDQAGATGLLVIDEPPPVLETVTLTPGDFALTLRCLDAFEGAYGASLRPALEALQAWATGANVTGQPSSLAAVVGTFEHAVATDVLEQARRSSRQPAGSAVACARAAPLHEKGPSTPPLRWMELQVARSNLPRAKELGRASLVLKTVHHGLVADVPVAARVEGQGASRRVHVTRPNEMLCESLRRQGSVVVLDANADLWAPVYAKIVGYERPIQRFYAPDGAPIERTMLRLGAATRTGWQPKGQLTLAPSLKTALRLALDWALEQPGNGVLAVITLPLVRLLLETCLSPNDPELEARWNQAGQRPEVLEEARALLGPLLRRWPGEFRFGHYGATRGLDTMADADNLITLGDPWANLDDVHHTCAYLGLSDWEARYEAMCRAELEQAHGRLRTVHRSRPGRALHVGTVTPGGMGWGPGEYQRRQADPGRPARQGGVSAADVARAVGLLGGIRAAARTLGVAPSTLSRAAKGERPLPDEATEPVLRLLTGQAAGCCQNAL